MRCISSSWKVTLYLPYFLALTAPQHTATVPSPSTTIQTPKLATRTTHIPNSLTKPSGITATTPTETSATTTTTSPAPIRAPSARATFHDFLMPPKFSLPPDTDRLQHVQTNSQVVCAARCLRMTGCRSFTLRPTENACNLYKGDYSGGGADVDPSDTKYFVKH
ncbi:hypothetical protein DPMN_173649 [Dreissena polymorpha]|uniref:Apple domain-containing protein n=1 Tax=Dreissena polymorpha TaxID=45954 RepID=A0A9D4IEE2_DREPO|nr:hypothetical protein DPMN_173649 [Dreissena polymorpha]